jgi:cyanophycinase
MHRGLVCLLALVCFAQSEHMRAGNAADVTTPTRAGFALVGGGKDPDPAFRWLNERSGGGDVVVVRASGTDAYNPYILKLGPVNSVETLIVKTPEAARDPYVLDKIRHAEALFIAGGDQWNYLRIWGPSPMRDAMQSLVDRGAPIGGTSAGLAVLSEYIFTAEHDTVTSAQALANPYDERVTVGSDFLRIPILRGIVTDMHFSRRDRMGRLLTFLARMLQDGRVKTASAIAIDESTAALVEPSGAAAIDGAGAVWFLRVSTPPETCKAGMPLTFGPVAAYRVKRGGSFDLRKWTGNAGAEYELTVKNGVVSSTQAGGSIY